MSRAIYAEERTQAYRYADGGEAFRDGCERRIVHTDGLMTVVIDFNNGPWAAPDPYHTHPHEQITYVAAGEVVFFCEGESPVTLVAGDLIAIPSGKAHTVQVRTPHARLVDSFQPIREDLLDEIVQP
jgi:quercetin dioxygenase-like cupin family protein